MDDDGRSSDRDGPVWRITPGLIVMWIVGVILIVGWAALTTLDSAELGVSVRLNGALLTLIGSVGSGMIAGAFTLTAAGRAKRRSDELEARREAQWQQREALADRRLTEIEAGMIERDQRRQEIMNTTLHEIHTRYQEILDAVTAATADGIVRERAWQSNVLKILGDIDTKHLAAAGVRTAESENRHVALVDRQERERAEVVATIRAEMAGIRATLAALQQEREQRERALAAMRREIDALHAERDKLVKAAYDLGRGEQSGGVTRINDRR